MAKTKDRLTTLAIILLLAAGILNISTANVQAAQAEPSCAYIVEEDK